MKSIKKSNYTSCLGCATGCCASFNRLQPPAFTATEFLAVQKYDKALPPFKKSGYFYYPEIKTQQCSLFKPKQGCQIYKDRPIDCKLWPFSIMMRDDVPWLVLYWSVCCEKLDKEWIANFIATDKVRALGLISSYGEKNIMNYAFMQNSRLTREKFVWVCKIVPNQ